MHIRSFYDFRRDYVEHSSLHSSPWQTKNRLRTNSERLWLAVVHTFIAFYDRSHFDFRRNWIFGRHCDDFRLVLFFWLLRSKMQTKMRNCRTTATSLVHGYSGCFVLLWMSIKIIYLSS
jgi:hypothetical protein